jgi:RNA polymerase sigma-70 factor (ECF subfamily)
VNGQQALGWTASSPAPTVAARKAAIAREEAHLEERASPAWGVSAEVGRETVERARAGDQRALAGVYEWYMPRVYRYVLARVGNAAEAEDLTEEILLKVLRGISGFRWKAVPFSAWLFRIAHNQVVSYFRRNGDRARAAPLFENIVDHRQDTAATVETRLTLDEVFRASQDLPEAQREVVALRFAVGLSISETAKALGKREGNIKVLQHKAVARLQRLLAVKPGGPETKA